MAHLSKIWPGYIQPYEDELFSSWYMRLTKSHYCKSYSFSKHYFDGHPIWNRDIDLMAPSLIMQKTESHTPLTKEQIKLLFLPSFSGKIFQDEQYRQVILSLGISHRKRNNYGLLACPMCLKKNEIYYRKEWRLYTSLVCSDCNCQLIDRCPECESPICFHRLENGNKNNILEKPLSDCFHCGGDLSRFSTKVKKNSPLDIYSKYLRELINRGYNGSFRYSFQYIEVLVVLARLIKTKSKKWNRIQKVCIQEYNLDPKLLIGISGSNLQSIRNRQVQLMMAFEILKEWPKEFKRLRNLWPIRFSDFSKDYPNMPYWLYKELKSN